MVKRFTKAPRKKAASARSLESVPLRGLVASVKRDLRRKLRAASKLKRRG